MDPDNGPRDPRTSLGRLAAEVRACTFCAAQLPLGPNPILRVDEGVRVLITGQAPGTRVHATGLPWNDPSGERLRAWLGVDRASFYDLDRFGVMAMGFCYPGKGRGGDRPPRPECAPRWHARVRALLPRLRLTLLVGQYALRYYLPGEKRPVAEVVRDFARYVPLGFFPLPHPSPRNTRWLNDRPWFEAEVIPALREAVTQALSGDDPS